MLLSEVSSKVWKENFQQKFVGFAKKSPVLLSMLLMIKDGGEGVLITHVNSGKKYFFMFNYEIDVKDFIAQIKATLVEKHYPRLLEEILQKHEFTSEELALTLEKNDKKIDELVKYEMRVIGTRQFRFDKILSWKNIAILTLEKSSFEDDELNVSYRYKFNGSLVLFLKSYRSGKFKSLEEASNYFFQNALLIDIIKKKELINSN